MPQNQKQQQTGQSDNRMVTIEQWEDQVFKHYGVPDNLRRAMAEQESGGDWNAISPSGVKGRYQMTQATAKQYGLDRNDPYQQVVAAARLLRDGYNRQSGIKDENAKWLASIAMYYGGGDAVDASGNLSTASRDGLSNPAVHVERVAKTWGELNRAGAGAIPSPPPADQPAPLQKVIRPGRQVTTTRGPVKPVAPNPFDLKQPGGFESAAQQVAARTSQISPEVQAEADRRAARRDADRARYEQKGFVGRRVQDVGEAFASTGQMAQQGFQNLTYPIRKGLSAVSPSAAARLKAGEEAQAYTAQRMAERQAAADSAASKTTRALAGGAINATIMAPLAMAGGAPAVVAATGLQQDWTDPKAAALNTALSYLPIKAGQMVSPAAAGFAGRVASAPASREIVRRGIEGATGGATGAGQYAGTQALLGRPIDPEEALAQGVSGAVLGTAMAPGKQRAAKPASMDGNDNPVTDINAPLTPDLVGQGVNRAGDFGATVQRAGDIRPRPQGTQPMPIQKRLSEIADAENAPLPARIGETAPLTRQEINAPSVSEQARLRQALKEPSAPPDVDAVISKAKQAAEASGRPVEGRSWDQQEAAIRDLMAKAEVADRQTAALEVELQRASSEGASVEGVDQMRVQLDRAKKSGERARSDLDGTLNRLARTSTLDTISALRKAGLLTGIKTHLRNVGGTGLFQGAEELARIPAAVVDLAFSAVTKKRTITGANPGAVARAGYEAATKGVREAAQILRRGATDEQLQALQLDREVKTGSKVLDTYVNGVFRTLAAEDKLFKTYAFRRALEDRAQAQALTEARQGKIKRNEVDGRVKELVANAPDSLAAEAILDAEVATFNNENLVSKAMSGARRELRKTEGGRIADFTIDLFLPFVRTPTNVVARLLEYSPVGFGKNAYQAARAITTRAFSEAEQRNFARTFGRASVGSGLILLGYKLYEAGLATGMSDDERTKRNRDFAAGRTPGAILNPKTNTWHQITGFSPVGSLIAIGASIAREHSQLLKNESQRPAKYAGIGAQVVAQQPLLIGAKDIGEAITQPMKTSERAGRIAGSFVPTIVNDVGELADPVRREGRGFTGQIQKRIPLLRQALPAATDALGRPLEDRKTAFFDPTLTSEAKDKTRSLERELTRLDIGLSGIQQARGETEQQFRERRQRYGQMFQSMAAELMALPAYRNAPAAVQRAAFDELTQAAKKQARDGRDNRSRYSAPALLAEAQRSVANAQRRMR